MSNMSYCRFENTLSDLQDCYENMETEKDDLSEKEKVALEELIELCNVIAQDFADN